MTHVITFCAFPLLNMRWVLLYSFVPVHSPQGIWGLWSLLWLSQAIWLRSIYQQVYQYRSGRPDGSCSPGYLSEYCPHVWPSLSGWRYCRIGYTRWRIHGCIEICIWLSRLWLCSCQRKSIQILNNHVTIWDSLIISITNENLNNEVEKVDG